MSGELVENEWGICWELMGNKWGISGELVENEWGTGGEMSGEHLDIVSTTAGCGLQ